MSVFFQLASLGGFHICLSLNYDLVSFSVERSRVGQSQKNQLESDKFKRPESFCTSKSFCASGKFLHVRKVFALPYDNKISKLSELDKALVSVSE